MTDSKIEPHTAVEVLPNGENFYLAELEGIPPADFLPHFPALEKRLLKDLLDFTAARPPLSLAYSTDTDEQLGTIVGGLSLALARTFKIVDPEVKNPQTLHWDRAFQIFNVLL